jgi:hypothetical protein
MATGRPSWEPGGLNSSLTLSGSLGPWTTSPPRSYGNWQWNSEMGHIQDLTLPNTDKHCTGKHRTRKQPKKVLGRASINVVEGAEPWALGCFRFSIVHPSNTACAPYVPSLLWVPEMPQWAKILLIEPTFSRQEPGNKQQNKWNTYNVTAW